MQYLLLAYADEKKWEALSKSEQDAIMVVMCSRLGPIPSTSHW
jgi:hypothetical protein